MLNEERAGELVAVCEECEERSSAIAGSRAIAVLRLMRTGWRVRTQDGATHTWCPACMTMPSIPAMKISG